MSNNDPSANASPHMDWSRGGRQAHPGMHSSNSTGSFMPMGQPQGGQQQQQQQLQQQQQQQQQFASSPTSSPLLTTTTGANGPGHQNQHQYPQHMAASTGAAASPTRADYAHMRPNMQPLGQVVSAQRLSSGAGAHPFDAESPGRNYYTPRNTGDHQSSPVSSPHHSQMYYAQQQQLQQNMQPRQPSPLSQPVPLQQQQQQQQQQQPQQPSMMENQGYYPNQANFAAINPQNNMSMLNPQGFPNGSMQGAVPYMSSGITNPALAAANAYGGGYNVGGQPGTTSFMHPSANGMTHLSSKPYGAYPAPPGASQLMMATGPGYVHTPKDPRPFGNPVLTFISSPSARKWVPWMLAVILVAVVYFAFFGSEYEGDVLDRVSSSAANKFSSLHINQGFHLQMPMQPLKEDDGHSGLVAEHFGTGNTESSSGDKTVAAPGGVALNGLNAPNALNGLNAPSAPNSLNSPNAPNIADQATTALGSLSTGSSSNAFTVASVMGGSNTIGANSSTEQRNMVKGKLWRSMTEEEKQTFRGIVGHAVPNAAFDNNGGFVTLSSRGTVKRLIVCERSKLIFCPIPKVANSAWKYLLRKLEGHEDKADIQVVNDRRKSGLTYLDSFAPDEAIALLNDPSYMKVVFVRDPYTRELSGYLNKFVEKTIDSPEYDLFMKQLFGYQYFKTKSVAEFGRLNYEQFVKQVFEQAPAQMNEHWAPQTYLCSMDLLSYDFVGHFENMQNDSRLVLDTLGFKHRYLPSQEEIAFLGTSAASQHAQYYTEELVQMIKEKFANDFNFLGYKQELELGPGSGTMARGGQQAAAP